MCFSRPASRRGFVAIITALVVTGILSAVAVVFSTTNFLGRVDTNTFETKDIARKVAEGCLEYARFRLASSSAYAGNESVQIDSYSCAIGLIESDTNTRTVKASSTVQGRTVNLRLKVASSSIATISLDEVSSF